jgi:hypothetical protein
MRRVSSRQRLVSWDAFEAAATNDVDSEGASSDYEEPSSSEAATVSVASSHDDAANPSRRKRRFRYFKRKNHGPQNTYSSDHEDCLSLSSSSSSHHPTVVPYRAGEVGSGHSSSSMSPHLENMAEDVQLHILSYLDAHDLRRVMSTNRKLRSCLLSSDAHHLWLQHCQAQWKNAAGGFQGRPVLVDRLNLPTAAGRFQEHSVNLPLLLSMKPINELPTAVDQDLLALGRRPAGPGARRSRRSRAFSELKAYKDANSDSLLVRFTGQVGTGDRCIRGNHPLPRPVNLKRRDVDWTRAPKAAIAAEKNPSLLDLLRRGAKAVAGGSMKTWRPFVAPHLDKDGSIQLTPRMVSYYEVSIKEALTSDNNAEDADEDFPAPVVRRHLHRGGEPVSDCVAVGLATSSFHLQSRMPGWDCLSFGYHGDDGGIFHSSGAMEKRFGPSFGSGDTIGCGIDFAEQSIFFTLNGNFLGYGWKGIDMDYLQNDLYPVVGIDTRCPIECNFGAKPFQFDLSSFIMQHGDVVKPFYKWKTASTRTTNQFHCVPR